MNHININLTEVETTRLEHDRISINGSTVDILGDISKFTSIMMHTANEMVKDFKEVMRQNVDRFITIGANAESVNEYWEANIKPLKVLIREVTDPKTGKVTKFDLCKKKDFWAYLRATGNSPGGYPQITKYVACFKNATYLSSLKPEEKEELVDLNTAAKVVKLDGGLEEYHRLQEEKDEVAPTPRRKEILFGDMKKDEWHTLKVMYFHDTEGKTGFVSSDEAEVALLNKLLEKHGWNGISSHQRKELLKSKQQVEKSQKASS